MTDHVAKVKAYIAKHDLEKELSNAVNEAIKQDSDDPYRVIIDYLKDFAQEEEDEDEIMEEHEMPVMKPRGKREQVIATNFEVPKDWTAPVFEKSEEDNAFLKDTMTTNKLMKNLTPSDREQLQRAFKPVEFASGDAIIKQGDKSENMDFYVLASGVCDISVTGKGSVMKATKGIAFGELALLHNAPRAATVTAEEKVTAFALDMISFKMILMGKSKQDNEDYIGFLNSMAMLSKLPDDQKQTIAGSLKEVEYPEGTKIIYEGDEGDKFYIIREGEVKCTVQGKEVSEPLTRGDFFGELALLSSDKRKATVTTTKPTTVLTLGRAEFVRMLGPMSSEIAAAAQAKRASVS